MDTLLPGISAERVPTSRLTVNVLSVPGRRSASSPNWAPTCPAPDLRVAGGRGDVGVRRPAHWAA